MTTYYPGTPLFLGFLRRREMMPGGARRPGRAAGVTLAVLCAVFAVAGASAQAAHATSSPLRYVALGDSYSAASGVLPPDLTRRPSACARPATTRTSSPGRPARGSPT